MRSQSVHWACAAGVVVMALASVGATASIAYLPTPIAFTPPYRNSTATMYPLSHLSGPCAAQGWIVDDRWFPASGNLTGVVGALAKGCPGILAGRNATASVDTRLRAIVSIPIRARAGPATISVDVGYVYSLAASFSGRYDCPTAKNVPGQPSYAHCAYTIMAGVAWGFYLLDATNGSSLFGDHAIVHGPDTFTAVANDSRCNGKGSCVFRNYTVPCSTSRVGGTCVPTGHPATGGLTSWLDSGHNCVAAVAGRCSLWDNWTLNASHQYRVVLTFELEAYVSLTGWPAAHSVLAKVVGDGSGHQSWNIGKISVR